MLVTFDEEFLPVFDGTCEASDVDVVIFFVGPGVFCIVDLKFEVGRDPGLWSWSLWASG